MNSSQPKGLPWSRGRGFRPKGPFQPARRPGEKANGSPSAPAQSNHNSNSHGNIDQSCSKPSNTYQSNNKQINNSRETQNASQSNMRNSNQDRGNQSNSYQGNNSTRDFRFMGKQPQQQSSSGQTPSQVQYSQNGNGSGGADKNEKRLLAKYNYKANPNSPLGETELSLSQGQKVSLIEKHGDNDQWWKVRADDGGEGYVPATYVMLLESKPSALPWLADQKQEEPLPEAKPVFKPYKSAYNKPDQTKQEAEEKKPSVEYYCEICDKQLNGPKPYGAHMASKAHKEEVELAKEYGRI